MPEDNKLPYWPAALNKKMAAAYSGLSVDTFVKVCPVKPIRFTQSTRGERYLRQSLDEWLMSLDPNKGSDKAHELLAGLGRKRRFGDRL
ncbi:hypothetical protein AB3480_06410 [Rhizobium mongolense]|uniref:hypothetical protein n=1 Tax=Rhizobium mongolense TaxID=57676 RepID=UPI0034A3078C